MSKRTPFTDALLAAMQQRYLAGASDEDKDAFAQMTLAEKMRVAADWLAAEHVKGKRIFQAHPSRRTNLGSSKRLK